MLNSLLICTACFICQSGCIGICWYAAVTSDFQSTRGGAKPSGWLARKALMESPRVLIPSSLTPDMDSRSIIELIEQEPALWSTISWSLSPSLGMVCTGTTFIPGRRSVNGLENLSALISFSRCSRRKSQTRSSLGGCCGSQWVMGYPSCCSAQSEEINLNLSICVRVVTLALPIVLEVLLFQMNLSLNLFLKRILDMNIEFTYHVHATADFII